MAKKGKGKPKKGKPKKKKASKPGQFDGPGDLRAVRYHVEQWKDHGVEEALNMLMMLGRDASFTVCKIAEERSDAELAEFGRRLVAVKPQFETNLAELRVLSVQAHLDKAQGSAKPAVDVEDLRVSGGAIALFDPARIAADLAGTGRPRKDAERVNRGDIAWFGLTDPGETGIRFTTQAGTGLAMRLAVQSGIVFCGPPEAADGARLGTVRLDPENTALDAHAKAGRFLRLKEGIYRLAIAKGADGVTVHIQPDLDPNEDLGLDPQALSLPD